MAPWIGSSRVGDALAEEEKTMRTVLRSTLILAIAGAAGTAQALESRDWEALEETAQHSLEYAKTNESAAWVNPDSGTEGSFTPTATHEGPDDQVCREYAVDAIIDGREEVVYGTACRRPDGSWVEANAEYREADPPVATSVVYSGTNWWWIIPSIAISGGYCSSSFCVGGYFGSYYPSWYYPWGIGFSYSHIGHRGYYYPYYGNNHYHHDRYRSRHVRHHRNEHQDDYRSGHQNQYQSKHKNHHRGGNSKQVHSRSRGTDHDRPTHTRSRSSHSRGERYASNRSGSRHSGGGHSSRARSGSGRSGGRHAARSSNRH